MGDFVVVTRIGVFNAIFGGVKSCSPLMHPCVCVCVCVLACV